jgi:hypothetical protein
MDCTEARILTKKYDSNATTVICGSKLAIFLWDKDITVIEIINEEISNSFKNYFEILWKDAKKV